MADLIKIKSGEPAAERPEMPDLDECELGYRTDEKALYIGTKDGNVRLCGADDIASIIARLDALESKN